MKKPLPIYLPPPERRPDPSAGWRQAVIDRIAAPDFTALHSAERLERQSESPLMRKLVDHVNARAEERRLNPPVEEDDPTPEEMARALSTVAEEAAECLRGLTAIDGLEYVEQLAEEHDVDLQDLMLQIVDVARSEERQSHGAGLAGIDRRVIGAGLPPPSAGYRLDAALPVQCSYATPLGERCTREMGHAGAHNARDLDPRSVRPDTGARYARRVPVYRLRLVVDPRRTYSGADIARLLSGVDVLHPSDQPLHLPAGIGAERVTLEETSRAPSMAVRGGDG